MTDFVDPHVVAAAGDPPDAPDETHGLSHVTSTGISNEKLGMWVFLGSECLLFGGLISTFLLYKSRSGTGDLHETPHDLYDIAFTSISSFVLLMSSLSMVLAVSAIQKGNHRGLRTWLLVTAVLGSVFISGPVYEFKEFFGLTGFHGVHVTIGIIMLVSALALSLRGHIGTQQAESIEIIGLYWHFVDVVWIIIFTVVYLIK